MKKTFLALLIVVLTATFAHAQSDWINYKIDSKLSVKLPSQPTNIDQYSINARTKDSVICIISIINLQKVANIDSATLAGMATQADFTSSIRTGMLGKMAGFTLGDFTTGKWHGYYCYNVEGANTASKLKTYTFMVIIGVTLYSLTAILPDDKDTKPRDDFFASLTLN
jgi:hypothetical protein